MENEELRQILKKLEAIEKKLDSQETRLNSLESRLPAPGASRTVIPQRTPLNTWQQQRAQKRAAAKAFQHGDKKSVKVSSGSMEEIGGRWFGHVGIFALIIGTAFFLKYAFDNNWIGEVGRVMIGIVSGTSIIVLGQYLRKKYLRYSDILIGGGIAILYLSIFSALSYYHLISSTVAFLLMALVTLFAGVISVIDDSKTLAVIGILGGFLTPVLVSTGQNRFYELFSYILLLDIGILGIALFKKWGRLNYLGFIGTVIMFAGWADRFYNVSELGRTLLFMSIFFIVYLFTSIMHHLVRREKSWPPDLVLIIANAAIFSITVYGMLTNRTFQGKYESILGFAALLLAIVYFVISHLARKANPDDNNLNVFLLGISVLFLTVAIPIQLTGYWITFAWFVEALILYHISFMPVDVKRLKEFGAVVYGIGIFRLFGYDTYIRRIQDYKVILNHRFFVTIVAVLVAYYIAHLFYKSIKAAGAGDMEKKGATLTAAAIQNAKSAIFIFFVVANVLTIYIITAETFSHYQNKISHIHTERQKEIEEIIKSDPSPGNRRSKETREKTALINNLRYKKTRSLRNEMNTVTSVLWAIYAVLIMVIGIMKRVKQLRVGGMIFFFITALKVFLDMWELGQLYRIISSLLFGVIALIISFVYTKYKDKIKEFYED